MTTCPYGIAVELVGGADELRRLAGSRQALYAWKQRGVPWAIVGPILHDLVRQRGLLKGLLDSGRVLRAKTTLEDALDLLTPSARPRIGYAKRSRKPRRR